jgi:hypothetical protein
VVEKAFLQGGSAFSGAQNVVKCVVKRGGVVVKVWLETTTNRSTKNTPTFCTFRVLLIARSSPGQQGQSTLLPGRTDR